MYIEIIIIFVIIILVLGINGQVSSTKFFEEGNILFKKLKEDDYDFLVRTKYGNTVDPDVLFAKRTKNGITFTVVILVLFISNFSYVNLIVAVGIGYFIFRSGYSNLKSYYKKHLHEIDVMLPYYLKNLEILVQHYTVPVALGKSINDAPPVFRDGLDTLINTINAGDSSIEPYMEFARQYPVRDSMRMMRLLYRLSLGTQERKQEQLLAFSRSISSLQQKARDIKYKNRLDKMEGKTMMMLGATGFGVMILLILAIVQMFQM